MKILILNWKDPKDPEAGGNEVTLFELASRLAQGGDVITWFARRFDGASSEDAADGIEFIRRGGKWGVYFQAYLFYRQLKDKPDAVIDVINGAAWLTPLYVKEPILVFANQLIDRVFFHQWPMLLAHLGRFWERFQYRWYRDVPILYYSRSIQRDLEEIGIPHHNLFPLTLGVDHQRYKPGAKSSTPLFVCVSRLVKWKRIDVCIHAMKQVCSNYPSANLVIVGKGPEGLKLKTLAKLLGLDGRVEFKEEKVFFYKKNSLDQKIPLLQKSWGLLLMSVKEGWGLVVSEANACGTLAIVSGVPGLRDNVSHMETGLLLTENPTPKEVAAAMCMIIETASLREKMANNAMQKVASLDWAHSVKALRFYLSRLKPGAQISTPQANDSDETEMYSC